MNIFSVWVFLEINLLVFVSLINFFGSNEPGVELKYFIIQRLASSFFLFSFFLVRFNPIFLLKIFMARRLLLKIAGAPFHL